MRHYFYRIIIQLPTVTGAGSHLGLTIVADAALDEYYCSSTVSTGFKVHKIQPRIEYFQIVFALGIAIKSNRNTKNGRFWFFDKSGS